MLLFFTLIASIAVNLYVVGLNQLTDIEIDKINKPYLPLVSHQLTDLQAKWIVASAAMIGIGVAAMQNFYLFSTIALVFLIGTAYSLPPIRLKRFSFFAGLSIILARGIIGNGGIYVSYTYTFTGTAELPLHVLIFILLMASFSTVIALMKDIPDIEGDMQHSISTLVTRIGTARVLFLCKIILVGCYLVMIGIGLIGIQQLNSVLVVTFHTLLLIIFLLYRTPRTIFKYYMFIWNLFYLEFIVFFLAVAFAEHSLV